MQRKLFSHNSHGINLRCFTYRGQEYQASIYRGIHTSDLSPRRGIYCIDRTKICLISTETTLIFLSNIRNFLVYYVSNVFQMYICVIKYICKHFNALCHFYMKDAYSGESNEKSCIKFLFFELGRLLFTLYSDTSGVPSTKIFFQSGQIYMKDVH